jgi:hypothetical protein
VKQPLRASPTAARRMSRRSAPVRPAIFEKNFCCVIILINKKGMDIVSG